MTSEKKQMSIKGKFVQYALVGAALGLYYGIFYTPAGDPDFGIAVILSIFAGLLTVIVRSWKKGFQFNKIVKDFFLISGFFLIFMLSLALRKTAFNLGGKQAVIIETTVFGALLGLLMAWQRFAVKDDKK
jgi:inner membrane protein involved in colicin E2 resistance